MLQISHFSRAIFSSVLACIGSLTLTAQQPHILETVLVKYGYDEQQRSGLLQLFHLYGIEISDNLSLEEAERELIAQTQLKCLRQGERFGHSEYNAQLSATLAQHRSELEEAAHKIGLIDAIEPAAEVSQGGYVALVPGALEQTMSNRFAALVDHINQGATPVGIVAVTGYRALQPFEAQQENLSDRTEAALMASIWEKYSTKNPDLQKIPFIVSQSPLKQGQVRSNTADTVEELIASFDWSTHSNAIVYVEQPFALRFARIFHRIPATVSIRAKGLQNLPDEKLYYYGDEVARVLYFQSQQGDGKRQL